MSTKTVIWVSPTFSQYFVGLPYNAEGYNVAGYDIKGWNKKKVHVTGYNKDQQYVGDWKCCGNKPGGGEYHFVKGNGVPGMNICDEHNHPPCIREEGGCIPMDGPDLERPRKYTEFTQSVECQDEHWKKTVAAKAKMLPPARPSGSGSGSASQSKGKQRAN